MPFPFEVPYEQVQASPDAFIDAIFACLESEFMIMPKGKGFVDYAVFESGYESLKRATAGFRSLSLETVGPLVNEAPIALIVLRTMLGFTPPEWAYAASQRSGVLVSQGFARTLDRNIRMEPLQELQPKGVAKERIEALVLTACQLLQEGAPSVARDRLHRLFKADTRDGAVSLHSVVDMGIPYAMLLYERFLGRPFAGHRDSVSEMVGDVLESAIEETLAGAGISFRKTRRAERLPNFDQAPDFIIPSEFNPAVVIEAKITEDDGTARDKVTRVQHLASLSKQFPDSGRFEVVACIAGRGFGVRREDMRKLIEATEGKVFTLQNLDRLVECTRLAKFATSK